MEPIKFQCFHYPDLCLSRAAGVYFENGEFRATSPEHVRLIQESDTWKAGVIVRVPRPGEADVPQGAHGQARLQVEIPPKPEGEDVMASITAPSSAPSPDPDGTGFPKAMGSGWWLLSDGSKVRGKDIAHQLESKSDGGGSEPEIEEGLPGSEE